MASSSSEDKEKLIKEPLLDKNLASPKGGFRTIPFILANEAFLGVATYGLQQNMILYLMRVYHLDMATGTNIIFSWAAAMNFMPLLGAIIADSFVGRFWMIGFGSIVNLVGLTVLCLTTIIPQVRPAPCNELNNSCTSATAFQLFFLCSSFGLISLGAGGVGSSSIAFGADQLKKEDDPKNVARLERYFNWYYAFGTFAVLIACSCIIYIQEKIGWEVGFGVPVVLMSFSVISFFLASSLYVKLKPKSSLVTELIQVIVASYRKRNIKISHRTNCLYHHEGSFIHPSEKLRYLNKACLIIDHQQELTPNGKAKDPWSLCTVNQVQKLKTVINVIPLWSTGMFMSITVCQRTFHVIQATSMNRKIGSSFEIPAGSFAVFLLLSMILWVVLYDFIILPVGSRIMGRPLHFSSKQRIGFGIFFSCLSMIMGAVVETIRRNLAVAEGIADDPEATVNMSALWLILPFFLSGFAEGSITVAQNEFFYSELPRSMSSMAANLSRLGLAVANLLASLIVSIVDNLTKRGGNDSWVSSNINKGHYDYYYWVLVLLCMLNMMYFCVCSKAYGPCKGENREIDSEEVTDTAEIKFHS